MFYRLNSLDELGERLANFGKDPASQRLIDRAVQANKWFTAQNIAGAIEALRLNMLQHDKLSAWLSNYNLEGIKRQRVAVVMAGNIPCVGFFDLLCVYVCGHACLYKPSTKDTVLIEYFVSLLKEIDPEAKIEPYVEGMEVNKAITTGSDNTNRYFRRRFEGIPVIYRGNRSSVAVLKGDETDTELGLLARDIFAYSGLGCRNVSMLWLPRETDLARLAQKLRLNDNLNPHYINNYRQTKALAAMSGSDYADGGYFLLIPADDFPCAVSAVSCRFYDAPEEVERWIADNENKIQCTVDRTGQYIRGTAFGRSQSPSLADYPDGVDVISFLSD